MAFKPRGNHVLPFIGAKTQYFKICLQKQTNENQPGGESLKGRERADLGLPTVSQVEQGLKVRSSTPEPVP